MMDTIMFKFIFTTLEKEKKYLKRWEKKEKQNKINAFLLFWRLNRFNGNHIAVSCLDTVPVGTFLSFLFTNLNTNLTLLFPSFHSCVFYSLLVLLFAARFNHIYDCCIFTAVIFWWRTSDANCLFRSVSPTCKRCLLPPRRWLWSVCVMESWTVGDTGPHIWPTKWAGSRTGGRLSPGSLPAVSAAEPR